MKKILIVFTAMVLSASHCMAASASISKITNVNIFVSEAKRPSGEVWEVDISSSNKNYEIDSLNWSTDFDSWRPGKKVTATVRLYTDKQVFDKRPSVYAKYCELVSVSRTGSQSLTVKLNYIPKITLETPEGICFEDEYTMAWDKVRYAGGYEVRLYREGSSFKKLTVTGGNTTSIDLSQYATDDYLITTAVRAIAPRGKTRFIFSSDWVKFDDEAISIDGNSTVTGYFSGSGEYKRFYDESNQVSTGWQYINGNWYYFKPDKKGYAAVNQWISLNNHYYYFDSDGRMQTGWIKEENCWYYLNMDASGSGIPYGAMITGWFISGPSTPWYYFNSGDISGVPYGAMVTNTVTPDGYQVDQNGEWIP